MVKKKIRKFFNSVPIHERMLVLAEEKKKEYPSLVWLPAALLFILAVFIGVVLLLKEDKSAVC